MKTMYQDKVIETLCNVENALSQSTEYIIPQEVADNELEASGIALEILKRITLKSQHGLSTGYLNIKSIRNK